MKKMLLIALAISGSSFADAKNPSELGFSSFDFKGSKKEAVLGAAYSFGAGGVNFPLYKTPKAQATEKQTLEMFSHDGYLGFGLPNQQINTGWRENRKVCSKANFKAKSVHLHHYLQSNYGVTPQQAQIKLKQKFPEVRAATLVHFDCPDIQWPREFVILRTRELIEKEGLGYSTPVLLGYKGVLFTGYPIRSIEGGMPVPKGIRVGG